MSRTSRIVMRWVCRMLSIISCTVSTGCSTYYVLYSVEDIFLDEGLLKIEVVRENRRTPPDPLRLSHTSGSLLERCDVYIATFDSQIVLRQGGGHIDAARSIEHVFGNEGKPTIDPCPRLALTKSSSLKERHLALYSAARRYALADGVVVDAAAWKPIKNLAESNQFRKFLAQADRKFSPGAILAEKMTDTHPMYTITDDAAFVVAHAFIYRPYSNPEFRQLVVYDISQDRYFERTLDTEKIKMEQCRIIDVGSVKRELQVLLHCYKGKSGADDVNGIYEIARQIFTVFPFLMSDGAGGYKFWDVERHVFVNADSPSLTDSAVVIRAYNYETGEKIERKVNISPMELRATTESGP